jgi:hypothetical protein
MYDLSDEDFKAMEREALEKAAKFLEGTAADYDQMATNLEKQTAPFGGARAILKHGATTMKEKAALLRGQAGHIRKLV